MARLPRLSIAGCPHLVIQRGLTNQPVFVEEADYRRMLALLAQPAVALKVQIHAYSFLPGSIQLLLTPEQPDALSRFMQSASRGYVQNFNRRHQRKGTLWEGRYRATILDAADYLLPCMMYLDHLCVVDGKCARPDQYPWSSARHYLGLHHEPMLAPPSEYWALGNTPFAREAAYRALSEQGISRKRFEEIRQSGLKGWALGDRTFLERMQTQTPRRLTRAAVGRPTGTKSKRRSLSTP